MTGFIGVLKDHEIFTCKTCKNDLTEDEFETLHDHQYAPKDYICQACWEKS